MAISLGNIHILTPLERQLAGKEADEPSVVVTPSLYQPFRKPYRAAPPPTQPELAYVNGGGGFKVTEETPPPQPRAPSPFEWIFPPIGLWNLLQSGGQIPTQDILPDRTTMEGSPEDIAKYQQLQPEPTPTGNGSDILGSVGDLTDLALKIAPLILIFGLFGSIKKLF